MEMADLMLENATDIEAFKKNVISTLNALQNKHDCAECVP
jgi:hypothetical protein